MPPEPIISVSGLRGIVGESLTEEVARRYATAFAEELPAGPVVIGRDGRASGAMFAEAIGAAIAATGGGRRVCDAGPASTPTVGVLVRDLKAAGGVQISASHNPPQYNGIKLFSAEGRVRGFGAVGGVVFDGELASHRATAGVEACRIGRGAMARRGAGVRRKLFLVERRRGRAGHPARGVEKRPGDAVAAEEVASGGRFLVGH